MVSSCLDTVYPADAVEFCPHPNFRNILVCGTYNLTDAGNLSGGSAPENSTDILPQRRQGKCLVFEHSIDELHQIQEISLPAVLDMKWCHQASTTEPMLGVADSEGNITLYEWRNNEKQLHHVDSISCASSDVLCLSLDWSNRRSTADTGLLVVSLSNGSLCLLRPINQTGLLMTDSWVAHDYEPWIAAWDYWDTNIIYSGGDDLKLKGWDIRQGFSQPTFENKRFEAGITTIQSHPHIERIIAVGSYDDAVRLFDARKPLVPLTQADVGGGAWRVKWHPSADRKNDLLVACMHDGFKIVRFEIGGFVTDGSRNEWEIPGWSDANRYLFVLRPLVAFVEWIIQHIVQSGLCKNQKNENALISLTDAERE